MIDPDPNHLPFTQQFDDDDLLFVVTNTLYGLPLFAFWIIAIEKLNPDEIKGMLLDISFEAHGPYESNAQALEVLDTLLLHSHVNGQQG